MMSDQHPIHNLHNPRSAFAKGFVNFWRKIYHPLGFQKGYNFPLFVILVGALMGFVLARFSYLNIDGKFIPASIPGESYVWQHGLRRVGIILHLVTILPVGFLVCFQFVPVIRHKFRLFHRINGYFIILLFLSSIAGVYIISRYTVGGDPNSQAAPATLATVTTITLSLAYYNIKRLQIDQHRAWMLRTWVYAGCIISLRLIQLAANKALFAMNDYYSVLPCKEIFHDYSVLGIPDVGNPAYKLYPDCAKGATNVAVHVDRKGPETFGAAAKLTFGMSLWIAWAIHAIGVELYLHLTPAETERLRNISYERQLAAGFKHPGSAGLTSDRFGDAPMWQPKSILSQQGEKSNNKGKAGDNSEESDGSEKVSGSTV